MDFAQRARNHSYHIDPIVRSLLDTDFYKLLMLQFIWKNYANVPVSFAMTNRTKKVHLVDHVDLSLLREHLDYIQKLSFQATEIAWLRGQSFYGQFGLFEEGFLDELRTFKLGSYLLEEEVVNGEKTGQIRLEFEGSWMESTMWEIYALTTVNELRYRSLMKKMNLSQLDIMYSRAKVKLYDKLIRLRSLENLNLTDFGTRRRHSFLWQEHCVTTAKEVLGSNFTGTSNALLAMRHNLEAKGTNAHELPMVIAALAKNDEELAQAQYRVLAEWEQVYRQGLLVMLPDTFGTTQFLEGLSPIKGRSWKGARPDSKNPYEAGEELLNYWHRVDGGNVENKLIIFSDGLDVALPHWTPQGEDIVSLYKHFYGKAQLGFGWGTMLTNDFLGAHPLDADAMAPLSLVCKVKEVDGRSAVKLSDNYTKATGTPEEIERYRKVFGSKGMKGIPVKV